MSNCSSSSSHLSSRNRVLGVPTKCWCGDRVITLTSKTNENPYRRFYRCAVGHERKTESHLFKWSDEALLEEIRLCNANYARLAEDFEVMQQEIKKKVEVQKKELEKLEDELKQKVKIAFQHQSIGSEYSYARLQKFGFFVVLVGSLAWIGGRFST